ncbi:MAG: hypothetical protein RRE21_04840 [Desulfurococcales archaeon]|jgi:hypothetical protein|nr:hypothetical protein [Desulfurococcales archaeon]
MVFQDDTTPSILERARLPVVRSYERIRSLELFEWLKVYMWSAMG